MVHNFKNYILRKDFNTFVDLERSMGATQSVVKQYIALSSSPAEKLALADIQTMLIDYQNSLDLVRIEIEKGRTSAEIDEKVKVDDGLAIRGLAVLSNEIVVEHDYFDDQTNNPVLASKIRYNMGYGGMIHSYKNYVLRNDAKYKQQLLKSINETEAIVSIYQKQNPTSAETTALEDILKTLEEYKENINSVDDGIANNLTPEQIDDIVIVDDTYALRGLQTIDQNTIVQIDLKSEYLTRMLKDVRYKERISGGIVIFTTIALAIFIFLVFRRKIIKPVQDISDIMYELSEGNLDAVEDIPVSHNLSTEICRIKDSLRIFKKNEIERRKAEQQIRELALTDALTGLSNRRHFEEQFDEMVALANNEGKSITLLAVDLDNFKPINDEYGHYAGDLVLKSVSHHLKSTLKETDIVARVGGDEFAVLMYDTDDKIGVINTVKRLINNIGSPVIFGKDDLSVGASVGINMGVIEFNESLDKAIQNADKALYKAKDNGKNTYLLYEIPVPKK